MVEPLIIEAALNGATTARRNPHTPRDPDSVARDALACLEAGATVIHNHTDDPVLGGPTRHASGPYLAAWEPVLAAHPDAVLYPTMAGGGGGAEIEERYAHIAELHAAGVLGLAVADPGSVNLVGVRSDGSPAPTPLVYENSAADVAWMFSWCRERVVPVHVSIFEPGFLQLVLAHRRAGTLPPAVKLQLYLAGPALAFGLPAEPWALEVYLRMLDGSGLRWMAGVPGGDVVRSGLARAAIEVGGHVRVGLEDHRGDRQPTNAELVAEVVALAEQLGRPVATGAEARALLAGPAAVAGAQRPRSGS